MFLPKLCPCACLVRLAVSFCRDSKSGQQTAKTRMNETSGEKKAFATPAKSFVENALKMNLTKTQLFFNAVTKISDVIESRSDLISNKHVKYFGNRNALQ